MDNINNHIGQAVVLASTQTIPVGQTPYSAPNKETATTLINKVFRSLKAIFPAWAVAIKDKEIESQARQEWLKGFVENGINSDVQIEAGLSRCRSHNSPFLPSVGQFIEWCKEAVGSLAGMPTESDAKLILIREIGRSPDIREWSRYHPSIYWAYCQRSSFDWKQMGIKDMNSNFSEVWRLAVNMARRGHVFQTYIPPERQIENTENKKKLSPEETEQALSSLRKMFDGL